MCDFLTLALPSASKARLAAWRRRNYHLSPATNASIKVRLPAGYDQWVLTTGGCSCNLVKHLKETPNLVGLRTDVPDLLEELLGEEGTGFMVVHVYSGDIETEAISLSQAPPLTTTALTNSEAQVNCDHLIPLVKGLKKPNQRYNRMAASPGGLGNRKSRKGRHR